MSRKKANSKKKFVATGITTAMVASIATPVLVPTVQAAGNFSDVNSDAYYAKAVNELASKGIVGGYSDGTFQPNKQVTRAEAAKILAFDLGLTSKQAISNFRDVKENDWFFQPVTSLAEAGGINGYEDGTFQPNKTITRAEMASLITKAYGLKADSSTSIPFTDVAPNSWYKGAVQALYTNKVTSGKGAVNTFAPNDPVTRGEMAVFVQRASQLKSGITPQVGSSNAIEDVTADGIVIGGTTYTASDSVKGILGEKNAAILKGAVIEFEETNGVISKIDSLQLNAAGSSSAVEFENNLVLDGKGNTVGKLVVDANYITIKNLTVESDLTITEKLENDFYAEKVTVKGNTVVEGGDDNTVVFKDSSLNNVDLNKSGLHFEAKGSTTLGTLTVSKSAKITSKKAISKVKVADGVKLTLGSTTKVGNIELPSGVKLEDVVGSSQQRENIENVNGGRIHSTQVGGGSSSSSSSSNDSDDSDTISFAKTITNAGTYGPASGTITIDGDLEIATSGVTLQNVKITGDLILGEGIGEGDVTLKGVTVEGKTVVNGGGDHSIHFEDSVLATVIVNKNTGAVRIVATGSTRVIEVQLETPVIIQEENLTDDAEGFTNVTVPESSRSDLSVELVGTFETINSRATNVQIHLDHSTDIRTLILNAAAAVLGEGVIHTAEINTNGSTLSSRPQNVVLDIDRGVSVSIGNETIYDSYSDAEEATITGIKANQFSITPSFDTLIAGLSMNDFNVSATLDGDEIELKDLEYNSAKNRFYYKPIDVEANLGKQLKITVAPADSTTGDTIKVIGEPQTTTVDIKNGFGGQITDIQGVGVEGASIKFRSGSGITEGTVVGEAVTDKYGYYSINLAPGTYTGELVKQGYVTTYLIASSASDVFLTDQNETAIRAAASKEIKIMLTWGETPRDLDSHLTGPTPDQEEWFHTAYYDKVYQKNGVTYVDLDWDDVNSYGPETTTIRQLTDGKYLFFVHNYSGNYVDRYVNSDGEVTTGDTITLRNSDAKVQIYKGNSIVADKTYSVPTGTDNEFYWVVFSLDVSNGGEDVSITDIDYLTDFAAWDDYDVIPDEVQQFKDPRHAIEQKLAYAQNLHSTDQALATAVAEGQAILANQNATQAELYAKLIQLLEAIEPLRDVVYTQEIIAELQAALNELPADVSSINLDNVQHYSDLLENIYSLEERSGNEGIPFEQLDALENHDRVADVRDALYKLQPLAELQDDLREIPEDLNLITIENSQEYVDLLNRIEWSEEWASMEGFSDEEIQALQNYDRIDDLKLKVNELLSNKESNPVLTDISILDGGTEGTLTTGDTIQFTFSSTPTNAYDGTVRVKVVDGGESNDFIEIYRQEEDDTPIRLRVVNADFIDGGSSATFSGTMSYDESGNIDISLDELASDELKVTTEEVELELESSELER